MTSSTGCCSKIRDKFVAVYCKIFPYGCKEEFVEQIKIAWPIAFTQITQTLILIVSMAFCGHLGKRTMDAAALGTTIINVTGYSVIFGMASACDTFFSQIYGSENKHKLGIILQRGILVLLLACIPCWVIFMNTEHILLLAHQDPTVAHLGGEYATVFIAALPAVALFTVLTKYLQHQMVVYPSLIIGIISNVLNVGLLFLFMFQFKMGIYGAAISIVVTQWFVVIAHLIYIYVTGIYKHTWSGWSVECLYDWAPFVKLAIPGLIMVCLEWWSYEIILFAVGTLGVVPLAAHTIAHNIAGLIYMIPLGLAIASSIRVGSHLGSGSPTMALTASRVSILLSVFVAVFVFAIIYSLKGLLPHAFSEDSDVIALSETVFPQLAWFEVTDIIQVTASGVIRGAGLQAFGAFLNIFTYWIIGLPIALSILLATNIGVVGGWYGERCGSAFLALVYLIRIASINWYKMEEKAEMRVHFDTSDDTVKTNEMKYSSFAEIEVTQDTTTDKETDNTCLVPDSQWEHKSSYQVMKIAAKEEESKPPVKWNAVGTKLIVLVMFLLLLAVGVGVRMYRDHVLTSEPMCETVNIDVINRTFINNTLQLNTTDIHIESWKTEYTHILNRTWHYENKHEWRASFIYCHYNNKIVDMDYEMDWPPFSNSWIFSGKH